MFRPGSATVVVLFGYPGFVLLAGKYVDTVQGEMTWWDVHLFCRRSMPRQNHDAGKEWKDSQTNNLMILS